MKRVTGLGGICFKSDDPEALYAWYEEHLGLERDSSGAVVFKCERPATQRKGGQCGPSSRKIRRTSIPAAPQFMLNFRVDDLDALLAALRAEGVAVDEEIQEYEYGRFAWIMDPEGNRIELWEPPR
jgi:predicted enzyme related to lactoylglutathione lyase